MMATAAATATVRVADGDEGGSGEAVPTAGNGGGGGDRCRTGCEGRGLEVIGVGGNDEDCGRMPGAAKGPWVMLDCAP